MTSPIFIDSSGLFALLVPEDQDNGAALDWYRSVPPSSRLVLTDYILSETATLLVARKRRELVPMLFEAIADSFQIRIEWIGPERFARARDLMLSHVDKSYSFTDCTSFIVMRDLGIRHVLTKDRHFAQAGFDVVIG